MGLISDESFDFSGSRQQRGCLLCIYITSACLALEDKRGVKSLLEQITLLIVDFITKIRGVNINLQPPNCISSMKQDHF